MNGNIEQMLREEGVYVSTTSGYSMWPMLSDRRDRVVLRAVGKETLKKGDLPLYRRPDGKFVLHRIIGVKRDGVYIIRGDNTYVKEQVPADWVLGVMTEFYRKGRRVSEDCVLYRLYAFVWQGIYPIRLLLFRARRAAGRIKRSLLGGGKKK